MFDFIGQAPPDVSVPLTLAWTGILALGVFMYVLMDGFDLGIGILFPFAEDREERDIMMNSIAPVWDGNETWLILGGAGIFAAFPAAYSILLSALYLPVTMMLIGLIFRGVSFEFRFKANRTKRRWSIGFFIGSLMATFFQGVLLGAFITGIEVENMRFVGGMWDWLSPFSIMTGLGLTFGYALLGSTWLIMKTEGRMQYWAYEASQKLMLVVVGFIAVVSVWTPFQVPAIAERWFSMPNLLILSPVPVITALLAIALWRAVNKGREYQPFLLSMGLFLLSFIGLAVSLIPYVVPPSLTLWEAASPPTSQLFLLVGMAPLVPVVLAYTAYTYWVFRGKTDAKVGYH